MSIWKQGLMSLAILLLAFLGWLAVYPQASDVLNRAGLGPVASRLDAALGRAAEPAADDAAGKTGQMPRTGAATAAGGGAPGQAAGGQGGGGQGGGGAGAGRGGFSRGPALVVVRPAGSAVLNDRVAALGIGAAVQSATLKPQASGTLDRLSIRSGDRVTAGQVVAELDSDAQQIAHDKAQLAAEDARASLDHARRLVATGTMPSSQLQAVDYAAKVAELDLRSAARDLDRRRITAPFDGTVGLVTLNPGVAVTTDTVLATLEDTSRLVIRLTLPERLYGVVAPGAVADLVPVSRPSLALQATITAVDPQVDAASGSFEVEAVLPNPDGTLASGMTFAAALHFAGDTHVAVDPLAVQWGAQGAYVWRLAEDGTVAKVQVRIVQRNTDAVLVAGEIAEGDPIVVEGLDGLRPGAKVQVAGQGGPQDGADPQAGGPRGTGPGQGRPAPAPGN